MDSPAVAIVSWAVNCFSTEDGRSDDSMTHSQLSDEFKDRTIVRCDLISLDKQDRCRTYFLQSRLCDVLSLPTTRHADDC